MSTRIRPLEREHLIERHDHRIATAWVRTTQAMPAARRGPWWTRSDDPPGEPVEADPRGPVLVMLRSTSAPALAELIAHARAGARLYVLAPSGWAPSDPVLRRCPSLLIRRMAEVPVSAVHTTSHARIWIGSTNGSTTLWRLRLDDAQRGALRSLFLRLFWHEALDEAWSDGNQLVVRPAAARPFEVPEAPANAAIRWMDVPPSLGSLGPEHRVHLDESALPSERVRRLWLTPSGSHHDALARLVRDGTTVVGGDRGLPDLATDGGSGVVVLPAAGGCLRLVLSPGQAEQAAALLDQPAAWTFCREARLGDHATEGVRLWLAGANEERSVQPRQVIDLPDVLAPTLHGMDEAAPTQWPDPHPLSLTVAYRFTVQPPRVPANAKEDPLVGRWRALDERWCTRLGQLEQALAAVGEHRGRLGSTWARLTRAGLGFGRTHEQLEHERSTLAAARPSQAGPEHAHDLHERLTALEARLSELRSAQEDAEHQARIEDERERQRAAWQGRVDTARRELPGKQAELEVLEPRRAELEDQRAAVERGLAAPDVGKQARKDLKVRRKKIDDDAHRLERRLARLRDERAGLERQVDEPFVFTPPERPTPAAKGRSGRFVPAAATPSVIDVPEQALPEVGVLRSLKGQRHLVIDAWEELARGEAAAQRLEARLCTSEDA